LSLVSCLATRDCPLAKIPRNDLLEFVEFVEFFQKQRNFRNGRRQSKHQANGPMAAAIIRRKTVAGLVSGRIEFHEYKKKSKNQRKHFKLEDTIQQTILNPEDTSRTPQSRRQSKCLYINKKTTSLCKTDCAPNFPSQEVIQQFSIAFHS
jgi:hypothetical protein